MSQDPEPLNPPQPEDPVIELIDVSMRFRQQAVLRDINLCIRKGETVCIIGESGCGKSVTAMSILRLLPEPPVSIALAPPARIIWNASPIAWLELAQAVATANYIGLHEPRQIILTRQGESAVLDAKILLSGAVVPLEPGDLIELR